MVAHNVSACGAANFEAVPGREQYGAGDDATMQWTEDMLEFHEENFSNAKGIEVRSMDRRELEVGLFGNFCERVGHGKFVEWRADEEHGGLYKLVILTKVHAACHCCSCVCDASQHSVPCVWQVVEGEGGETCLVPCVPAWGTVLEYVIKSSTGHSTTPKGGTAEYRNGLWYKKVSGKAQGDRFTKKKAFGYGSYAGSRMRFTTIEAKWSALKMWYDDELKDTTIANPARNTRIEKVDIVTAAIVSN